MLLMQPKGQKGQGGVEYALLLSGIAVVIILVTGVLFTVIRTTFRDTLCEMDSNGRVQYECNDGVAPGEPIAAFLPTCSGLQCNFDASTSVDTNSDGTGTIVSYSWDIAGTPATGVTTSRTFAANGSYPVTLIVTDNDGNTDSISQSVSVIIVNNAPIPGMTVSCPDLTCTFTVSASDSDGSVVSYELDFGDGAQVTNSWPGGFTTTHTYSTSGSRTAKFKVTDDGGKTAIVTRTALPIIPPSLLAHIADLDATSETTTVGYWKATITITVKDGNNAPLNGVTVSGNFNNGAGSPSCTTNASGVCTLESNPVAKGIVTSLIYTVTNISDGVSIVYDSANNTDPDGESTGTWIRKTNPDNPLPNAVINNNIPVSCSGAICTFDALSSTDDGTIIGYLWSFGSGSGFVSSGSATSANVGYTYAYSGSYTVTLTVTDDQGGTDSATTTFNVTAPANTAPSVTSMTVTCSSLVCDFNGLGTDSESTVTYSWNFGDSGAGTYTLGSATSQSGKYTYATPGTYNVTLTVTDIGGLTATNTPAFSHTVSANIWIDDIDAVGADGTGNKWTLNTLTFHVRDSSGNNVNAAVVSITHATAGTKTCTTGSGGTCTTSGSYGILLNNSGSTTSFTGISVTLSPYTYQASSNSNTDETTIVFSGGGATVTIENPR